MTATVVVTVTVAESFVISILLVPLPLFQLFFYLLFQLFFCPEVVASLWAAKPRRRVQHKEQKPRPRVSKETGPMQNDNDGQDTEWDSLYENGFQSQGTGSSDSLSTISSSNDSSSNNSSSDSASGTDTSDNST